MHDVMGVINLSNEKDSLNELTYYRNHASVPFGSKYRLIDFPLSNMVNSGIQDIAILTKNKYRSLMDHLGTGRDWDLDRKRGGLFILPPYFPYSNQNVKGDLHNFHQHLDFFVRGHQKYVLITSGHIISNMDFRPAFQFHQKTGADITVIYKEINSEAMLHSNWNRLNILESGRVIGIEEIMSPVKTANVSIEMYIMEKALLLEMIEQCINSGKCQLVEDGMMKNLNQLKVYAFPYREFAANIDSIASYYQHSMELLNPKVWNSLFNPPRFIYTKIKNDPPTKYTADSNIRHSIIANGCIIEGKVENSILFRGVKVQKGAYVKNSIIMQKSEVGENALVEYAIIDKKSTVTSGKMIKGEEGSPFIVSKRMRI